MNLPDHTRDEMRRELDRLRDENRLLQQSLRNGSEGMVPVAEPAGDSYAILKATMESLHDTIVLTIDRNYNYLYFNNFHRDVMQHAYGTTVEIGVNLMDCITVESDRVKSSKNYDLALSGVSHITIEEYGDLERSYYETRYNPILNDRHEVIGATAYSSNITGRRRAEEAVLAKHELFRKTFSISPLPSVLTALPDRTIVDVNPAFESVFGYTREETIGHDVGSLDLWSDVSERDRVAAILLETGKVNDVEFEFKTKSGAKGFGIFFAEVIEQPGEKFVLTKVLDITGRKQTFDALIESEARIRNVFEQANDGIYIISAENRYMDVNRKGLEILGYSREELLGMGVADVLSPREISRLAVEPPRMMSGIPHLAEWEHVRKDGSVFPGEVSAKRIDDNSYLAIVRNLQEKRDDEKLIVRLNERISLATRAAGIGAWDWDIAGDRLTWDEQMYHLYGVSSSNCDVAYDTWVRGLHPDDREHGEEVARMAMAGEQDYNTEFRVVWPDGSVHFLKSRAEVYRNEKGEPIRMIGVNYDITERKLTENALKESESKLSLFILHAPASLAMFDDEMRYIACSNRWLEDYSLGGARLAGKSHYEVFPEIGDEWKMVHKRALAGEVVCKEEDLFVRADGSRQWLHWEVHPWFNAAGEIGGIVVFSEDITERVEFKKELEKLNVELEERVMQRTFQLNETNRELEAFSYSVSHDLRAPLRAINGFARILMEEHAAQLNAEGVRFCSIINDSASKMGILIDELLNFSRLSRKEINRSPIDMKSMVNSIYYEITDESQRQKIRFTIGELVNCQGDPTLFRQVWFNVLSNAVKFSSQKDNPAIEVQCLSDGRMIKYTVTDNGAGFDMKYRDKLFGVFQRLHSDRDFEGTGVGLAIVHRIILRHGGEVGAFGEVGKGASFWFSVPVVSGESVD